MPSRALPVISAMEPVLRADGKGVRPSVRPTGGLRHLHSGHIRVRACRDFIRVRVYDIMSGAAQRSTPIRPGAIGSSTTEGRDACISAYPRDQLADSIE